MTARVMTCVCLFAASACFVEWGTAPVAAQGKDNKGIPLEKQLRAAQSDLLTAQRQITLLRQELIQLQAANNKLQAAAKKDARKDPKKDLKKDPKKDAKEDEKGLKGLRSTLDGYRNAGLVHVVVLKAKADTRPEDERELIDESYSHLAGLKTVRGLWAGKPAAKSVEGAATDYTLALVLVFDDVAGLRAYYDDPVHQKFMERHLKKWETPLVYDFEPKKPKP